MTAYIRDVSIDPLVVMKGIDDPLIWGRGVRATIRWGNSGDRRQAFSVCIAYGLYDGISGVTNNPAGDSRNWPHLGIGALHAKTKAILNPYEEAITVLDIKAPPAWMAVYYPCDMYDAVAYIGEPDETPFYDPVSIKHAIHALREAIAIQCDWTYGRNGGRSPVMSFG